MNTAAVRSVRLHTLNRQRANIVFSEYLASKKILTPKDVSMRERIFEWDGILRWRGGNAIGKAKVGVSLQDLLKPLVEAQTFTGAMDANNLQLSRIMETFRDDGYMISFDLRNHIAHVVLKGQVSPQDQIKAWVHALWVAHRLRDDGDTTGTAVDDMLLLLDEVQKELSSLWPGCLEQMKAAGWDLSVANIETKSGLRITLGSEDRGAQGDVQVR